MAEITVLRLECGRMDPESNHGANGKGTSGACVGVCLFMCPSVAQKLKVRNA